MINFVLGYCDFSPKNVSSLGKGIRQGHHNKISIPSASFMINMTQFNFKNYWFLRFKTSTLCQEK